MAMAATHFWLLGAVVLAIFGAIIGLQTHSSFPSNLSQEQVFVLPSHSNTVSKTTNHVNVVPSWQSVVPDTGLVYPLVGGDIARHAHEWKVSSTDGVFVDIPVSGKPSDVITDLMNAKLLDDPYFDSNFLTQLEIWAGNISEWRGSRPKLGVRSRAWTYATEFTIPPEMRNLALTLVVEGMKMGASIVLNNETLGVVTDQFLRYEFPISQTFKHNNVLSITFDPSIPTNGRFAGYSGGWDWAAYIPVGDERGSRYWTFGMVREVYLVASHSVYVSHVVPKIYFLGKHPNAPITSGDFQVVVQVHVVSPQRDYHPKNGGSMALEWTADFFSTAAIVQPIPSINANREAIVTFNVTVSKNNVELWWPNGMGAQKLYVMQVRLVQPNGSKSRAITKRIGFRTAALVTIDDTNDETVSQNESSEGSGSHGMYFRINGALVWARGGNMIPMDQLEGRLSNEAHKELVRSTADANMNMLRIWGGGMVLPEAFYNACDEYGVLLFHDMMFVQEHNHGAIQTPTVTAELQHMIRSLSHHASIVLWNGCNECSSVNLFASYIMRVVADADDTRAIWPSSPSSGGWGTGVRTIDGRPNGNTLTIGRERNTLEVHGPYGHSYSNSFPSVNAVHGNLDPKTPPRLSTGSTGPMHKNQFASEFGSSVMSSFESMSGTLSPDNWNIHGKGSPAKCTPVVGHDLVCEGPNVMSQRNYACDSHIQKYFGAIPFEKEFGARAFQAQLYECMISQSLWMKGQFEFLRSQNSFGALIWQLNENWPTGGWGSIEYGTPTVSGQVVGGRWKPLMHMFQNSLLRDVFATCGRDRQCFVKNDGMAPVDVDVKFEYWTLTEQTPFHEWTHSASLEGGVAASERFELETTQLERADVVLIRVQETTSGTIVMKDSAFLRTVPKDIPGLKHPVSIAIAVSQSSDGTAMVTLESDFVALYVTLTTVAQGRFSDNALHLRPHLKHVIEFLPLKHGPPSVNIQELTSTLRVEHLGSYIGNLTTSAIARV